MIGTFDPNSRPLLLEIDVPTPDGRLYAGMYAHAKILLQTPRPALLIQDNTIQIDSSESRVVIVAFFNKIHVTSVKLRRDFGANVEILELIRPPGPLLNEQQTLARPSRLR